MKTTKYLITTAILCISFTGCNNDDDPKPEPPIEGDISVQLTLKDARMSTYAAGTNNEPPIAGESKLGDKLEVYVFDSIGNYEYYKQVDNLGGYTDPIKISAGPKFFYVFSKFPGNLPMASEGTKRVDFEKNIREATFASNNTSISQADEFFIGTLWGDTARVKGSGTTASPENITLNLGRIASKIKLTSVPSSASGNILKGSFDSAYYRIRTIPNEFYIVGQHDGGLEEIPPGHQGVQVISAVHEEPPGSSKYFDYEFPDSTQFPPNVDDTNGAHFYTIENTSKPDGEGKLFYGNTTYIQLKLKYVPDESTEVYDGTTGLVGGRLNDNKDFYVGTYNGSRLIFNSNPTIPDVKDIKFYPKGLNYYNIPIKDISEETLPLQATIIRNHYYDVSVKSISRLGENTNHVDPNEPIVEDRDIIINVAILNWSKIKYEPEI